MIDEGKDPCEEDFYVIVSMDVDFDELVNRIDWITNESISGKIALHSKIRDAKWIVRKDGIGWKLTV